MNIQRTNEDRQKARLFFALWPSPAIRDQLYAEALACRTQHGGRVMQKATLHMTLLFLGDVPRSDIPELVRQVDRVQCAPFSFHLEALKCWRHNRIAYMSPAGRVTELHQLAEQLREAAAAAQVSFDGRAFTPHVTLLRKLEKSFDAISVELPEWRVSGFSLIESMLQAEGARYQDLHSWRCG